MAETPTKYEYHNGISSMPCTPITASNPSSHQCSSPRRTPRRPQIQSIAAATINAAPKRPVSAINCNRTLWA